MTELEYCTEKCGELTEAQIRMVKHHIKHGTFVGVGRAVGRSVYFPLISLSVNLKNLNVINKAGHYDLVAMGSGKMI